MRLSGCGACWRVRRSSDRLLPLRQPDIPCSKHFLVFLFSCSYFQLCFILFFIAIRMHVFLETGKGLMVSRDMGSCIVLERAIDGMTK